MTTPANTSNKFVGDATSEELRHELARRDALALKAEYDRRLAVNAHLAKHLAVFTELARLLGHTSLAKRLTDPVQADHLNYDSGIVVTFTLSDDDAFAEKISDHRSGGYVWTRFVQEAPPAPPRR